MQDNFKLSKTYFELSEHNFTQVVIFYFISLCGLVIALVILLPVMQWFFHDFLRGTVYNDTGVSIQYFIETSKDKSVVSYIFNWAIDLNKGTSLEARYWFNPFLTLVLQSALFGLGISIIISSLLPESLGYMRQKIDREVVNTIEKISQLKYGYHSDENYKEVLNDILYADLRSLQSYVEEWNMTMEDLKTLHNAIKWMNAGFLYRLWHVNDGIRMYMRYYFTVQYSNTILGFVYIGAAVLIIIIGLRGLKFIPPTEPSLVLFALGLEFSLLIVYAVTLMYSRQEEEFVLEQTGSHADMLMLGKDFGSSKDIENLLRVFINKKSPDKFYPKK
ncbi:MAG: hypothetical protein A2X61_14475 [Ignavibacteria bacterium GWB2_35_12]|nr:MAG: hypothetical protein A2X63_04615 [Ignavibacteria bacterium GWA2_35_8]OGU41109.1 MAG: hypothetical protein A2X61_14475 [Ignavibacteria bacterium GWB2_35_12]OGU94717.1 MAG: hypothetical protein A2220_04060 [Ignavibacteria bacterium RIFOXYA2_FULL_35_10]OGV22925.1 MAG: hypothetical protein A2475_10635 [Ignavibacteria bacterium RIFOXYC2_FULL_35_21]